MSETTIIPDEKAILHEVRAAVLKVITDKLGGYQSPLIPIVQKVVNENEEAITQICRDALGGVVKDKKFKDAIKDEFLHKVAKSLVGKLEGAVEKAAEKLRQDQTMRARMILAIENIVSEN